MSGSVIHKTSCSASELTYSLYRHVLPFESSRIAIYGATADYMDDTEIIRALLKKWDKRTVNFEAGILIQGIEGRKRDYQLKRSIIKKLTKNKPPSFHDKLAGYALENTREEESIIQIIKKKVVVYGCLAYTIDIPFSLSKTAIYSRALTDSVVGIAGDLRNETIDMSLRTIYSSIDLNRILRKLT